jgi:hypothetical protein
MNIRRITLKARFENIMRWTKRSMAFLTQMGCIATAVGALTAGSVTLATPASASWDHIHTVHSVAHSNLCLDVRGDYQGNGNIVWMYGCNNTDAQNWTFKSLGVQPNGTERFIISDPHGYCLDAPAQFPYGQPNHGVQIWACNGGFTQIWDQSPGGLNPFVSQVQFALRNENNGLWLDDAGNGGQGTQLITYWSNYGANQTWTW